MSDRGAENKASAEATPVVGHSALVPGLFDAAVEAAHPIISPNGAAHLIAALVKVMSRVRDIPKTGRNKADNYAFVETTVLYAKLQDAFVLERVILAQREIRRSVVGKVLFINYQFDAYYVPEAPDSSSDFEWIINIASNTGACRFEFKSGTFDDKASGKSYSYAAKCGLVGLFRIPADVDDIERDDVRPPENNDQRSGHSESGAHWQRGVDQLRDQLREGDVKPVRPVNEPARGSDEERPRSSDPNAAPVERVPSTESGRRGGTPNEREEPPPSRWGDDYSQGTQAAPDRGRVTPPAENPDEINFRRLVTALGDALKRATTEEEAARIWTDNSDLVRKMNDPTYEYFRRQYVERWDNSPPAT